MNPHKSINVCHRTQTALTTGLTPTLTGLIHPTTWTTVAGVPKPGKLCMPCETISTAPTPTPGPEPMSSQQSNTDQNRDRQQDTPSPDAPARWRLDQDTDFDPGGVNSPLKYYVLNLIDRHNGLTYNELADISGMPPTRAGSYLTVYDKKALLKQRPTPGPGADEYHLTNRGKARLDYFRRQAKPQ